MGMTVTVNEKIVYLAHGVKELVEVSQDAAAGHLGNVVHTLTCIVSHAGILVSKAHQHRWHNAL